MLLIIFLAWIIILLGNGKGEILDFFSELEADEYGTSNEDVCSSELIHLNASSEICYKFSSKLVKGPYVCANYLHYVQVPFDVILEEFPPSRLVNMDVWVPVYRNTIDGYNPLTYFEITENYGKNASLPSYNATTAFKNLCVKLKNGHNEVLSPCDEKAVGVCAYRKDPKSEDYSSTKLVTLALSFDNHRKTISLEVSPLNVLKTIGDHTANIFCFTDANSNLLQRVSEEDFSVECKNDNKIVYKISNLSQDPSHYWCEAFNVYFNLTKSKRIVAHSSNYGHEFVVHAVVHFEVLPMMHFQDYLLQLEEALNFTFVRNVRLMKIDSVAANYARVIFHLTTHAGGDMTLEQEFDEIVYRVNQFREEHLSNDTLFGIDVILLVSSSEACLPEKNVSGQRTLSWPLTLLGETAVSNELCFQQDGNPVTRECKGNFLEGAYWSKICGVCSDNSSSVSTVTDTLYELYHSNASVEVVFQNVTEVVAEVNQQFKPIDVYFVAQICKKVYNNFNENVPLDRTMTLISNMMDTDVETLQLSQKHLNSTDAMLNVVDTALGSFNLMEYDKGFVHMLRPNLMSLVVNISVSDVRGLALFSQKDDAFKVDFKYIYSTTDMEQLLKTDGLDIATYIPEKLFDHLSKHPDMSSFRLAITVFYGDALFNEDAAGVVRQSVSKIASVSLLGYPSVLPEPIRILYRPQRKYENEMRCAFWKFGKNDAMESIKGLWQVEEKAHITENGKGICEFSHLTHFSLLIVGKTKEHTDILNIITGVGSILSILGILGIFVTALMFKSWRHNTGHKILLQFSVTNILKIIFLYLAGMETFHFDAEDNRTKSGCAFVGMMLHYTILAEFIWMLIIAGLQFRRFVLVLCPEIPRLMWKATLMGWCFPLFPVAIVYLSSNESYISNTQICYPDGWSLYLGLLLPVCLIIFSNITIFVWIMVSVSVTKVKSFSSKSAQDHSHAIINLSVLLFFLLGVSWIFGFAAALDNGLLGTIFSYLFCFTAPLQGLVSFLYFIVLNDATKKMWYTLMSVSLMKRFLKERLSLRRYRFSESYSSHNTENSDDTAAYDGSFSKEEMFARFEK